MNFKNTKTAKVVSGFVGIATAVMMMGPSVASADAISDLTAQINALLAQVSALQAAQSGTTVTPVTAGYVFSADLTLGSKGADVTALQTLLVSKGHLMMPAGVAMGYFGGLTKSAVAAWQTAAGIMPAAGYVGPKSRAALNASAPVVVVTPGTPVTPGTTPVVMGTGVMASLDASSPTSRTLISPQGVASLAVFKISNGSSAAAKVTMLKFKRTGISSDTTLNDVYLYDAMGKRITDSASVATGYISFSDSSGIVTVPAMGSVSVVVRADIAALMNGQTLGVMLTDAMADAGAVTGLPVSGAEHTFATAPAGMSSAVFNPTPTPLVASVDPQNDYVLWQTNLTVNSRDAHLSSMTFQQLGSVNSSDVKNFRLMIDGTQVGSAVETVDTNRYLTFRLATPAVVKAGSHVVKVMGDIIGGSTRTVQFSLRRSIDVELTDSQLAVAVTPTVSPTATFAALTTGIQTVLAGSLTITKDTTSPSGNVVLQGSAVTLAKFKLRASGEEMKVENLTVGFLHNGSTTLASKIRNAALFANGVQVGSTQDALNAGTAFNLGSSLVVAAGKDVMLEIRADVYNPVAAGGQFVANATITPRIYVGSSNVYGRSSLAYTQNVQVDGNTLTVASGSMTLAKYSAYASQTVVAPQTAYKLADFRLTTGSTEAVNLNTLTLTFAGSLVATTTDLSNIYVVYGAKTSQIKSTGGDQSWSINEALAANTTMNIAVYGTLGAGMTSGIFLTPSLALSGTSQASGNAVTASAVAGQTITAGAGAITSALDASTPVAANVVANSMPKVASFKFTGSNDAFTITELTSKLTGTVSAAAVAEIVFKDGATTVATQSVVLNNGVYTATTSGLSIAVPYNSTKIIDAYVNLGGIGTGYSTTSVNVAVTLDGFEFQNSNGVKDRSYTDRVGNSFYAFKTKPTITNVALPTSVLSAGTMTVAKFTVTADAGGTVAWKKIRFATSSSAGVAASGFVIYDAANESAALANTSASSTASSNVIEFVSTTDQEVSGSKTYVVKALLGGTIASGASFGMNIPSGVIVYSSAAANGVVLPAASFVWSDESVLGHSLTTNDWFDDFLVKNIPTDTQTLTK